MYNTETRRRKKKMANTLLIQQFQKKGKKRQGQ